MKIDLKEYFAEKERFTGQAGTGPVITLSREYGCSIDLIARKLVSRLNDQSHIKTPWKYLNKEILMESAQNLHLNPLEVEHAMSPHEKNFIEDIFTSFSTERHVNENKIHENVRDVILAYANRGNIVVVGQGGVAITRHIRKSLHVKVIAPMDWRVEQIRASRKVSAKEAESLAREQDKRRDLCIRNLLKHSFDHSIFDLVLNRSTLSEPEIVDQIVVLAHSKGLIDRSLHTLLH